jgi:hypothetical protein
LPPLIIDQAGHGGFQRGIPQIPLGGPGEPLVIEVRNVRHAGETEIAALGQHGGVQLRRQLGVAGGITAGMFEPVTEAGPTIDFHKQYFGHFWRP